MLQIEINPTDFSEKFISCTKESYGNSFNRSNYEWMFERKFGNVESDIIVLKNENEVIAGSGLTYRQLLLPNKKLIDIAIMTSSWTLASARGMGCFSKMIEQSKEISFNKKMHSLTAFVTEENASYRRLKNDGSYLVPAYYIFSTFYTPFDNEVLNIRAVNKEAGFANIFTRRASMIKNDISFCYDNYFDFESQFIRRYLKTEVIEVNDNFAIIEETSDIIKLLLLTYENMDSYIESIKSLVLWCKQVKNKRLLFYSTDPEVYRLCKLLDFDILNGYFTMLFSNNYPISEIFDNEGKTKIMINIQYGDKM